MANKKSAEKRWHQSLKRRDRNRSRRSLMRTALRAVRESAAKGDGAATGSALAAAYSTLDRAAKTGAIHTGKADRLKRRVAALAAKSAA
jgi:small subunit ribosomal protein S20